MDIDGYKLCVLDLYRLCNAQRTWTVFCRKELREKVGARIGLFLGLKSAHTDRLFVVISCEKISGRFSIGAKVSAHEPISICGNVYDRLDYESHATDRLKL